jgi:DNA-binding IclR family transcriptional regulator
VTPDGDAVVSLRRSLEILRAFQPDDGPLSRHEIAQRTGLPNTTVTRLIHTLLTLGYLSRVGAHSSYRPGPSVLAIGHALIEALPIRRIARPLIRAFAAEFDVWVTLGTAEGDVLVLDTSHRGSRQHSRQAGSLLPMATAAVGRAYCGLNGRTAGLSGQGRTWRAIRRSAPARRYRGCVRRTRSLQILHGFRQLAA